MKNELDIEALLRGSSVEGSRTHAHLIDEVHSKILQKAAAERRLRNSILYGVTPFSTVIGIVSMWMMSVPGHWIAIACFANVALVCLLWLLVKALWTES